MKDKHLSFDSIIKFIKKDDNEFLEKILDFTNNPVPKSNLFPYSYYSESHKLFFNNPQGIGFVLEALPVVGCDESLLKQLSLLFDDVLPDNGYFQFLLIASHKIDGIINNWQQSRVNASQVLQEIAKKRGDFIEQYGNTEDSSFRLRDYRLIISYSEDITSLSPKSLARIIEFRERLMSLLISIGVYSEIIAAEELLNILHEIVNYDETPISEHLKYNPYEELNKQLSFTDTNLCVSNNEILHSNGKFITRCYQVVKYPEEFSINLMANLLGDALRDNLQIPSRFLISYTVCKNISSSKAETMKVKGQSVIKQADSFFARFNNKIKEEAKEWKEIERRLDSGEKLITSAFSVSVTAPKGLINKTEQHLITLYNSNNWKLKRCDYFQIAIFMNMLPLIPSSGLFKYLHKFGIAKTVLSSEPKAILPIHAEWKGHNSAGMLLAGRKGQLFNWDPFKGGSNYNACIIGESGGGKSVFLQEFISTQLSNGAKVYVLDIGRSYENVCGLLKGDFIDFSTDSKIVLNPFSNILSGSESEQDDFLSLITPILARMAAPKKGTSDIEDSILASVIKEAWVKHGNNCDITKIVQILKSKKGRTEQDIANMLFQYTEEGSYGRFFNKTANISFKNQLTVIEFEELRERRDLLEVIMQMFSVQIMQQVFLGNREKRSVILFDEGWLALGAFPEMLASLVRTVRKYNCSLVIGTQSVNDFFKSKEALSVLENSSWLVCMKQNPKTVELLRTSQNLSISEPQINLINSLETRPGKYSEILFSASNGYFVGRLILDPFSRILYSTKPSEFNKVKSLIKSGVAVSDAVSNIAEEIYG